MEWKDLLGVDDGFKFWELQQSMGEHKEYEEDGEYGEYEKHEEYKEYGEYEGREEYEECEILANCQKRGCFRLEYEVGIKVLAV